MRPIALIATLALPVVAASGQAPRTPARCVKPGTTLVGTPAPKAGVRKLGDMPPAKQVLTVLREVDGCPRPVVVREGIGAPR